MDLQDPILGICKILKGAELLFISYASVSTHFTLGKSWTCKAESLS
jgi:hypothetical protein